MSSKPTKRKGFNFFRSYYDIYFELNEKDKVKFMDALLKRQFEGLEPNLEGMSKFAYISQKHSIDKQVKGYEDKTGEKLTPTKDPTEGGAKGCAVHPAEDPCQQVQVQVQEKEEVQEKEKEKGEYLKPSTEGIDFTKLLLFFNSTFNKKSRTVSLNVRNKYKARLKEGFTKEDIFTAMKNASQSNYHKGENFNHCTLEFFSRADKLDKYINFKEQKNGFKKDTIANQPDYAKGKRKDFTKTTF